TLFSPTATSMISAFSLHDALPIYGRWQSEHFSRPGLFHIVFSIPVYWRYLHTAVSSGFSLAPNFNELKTGPACVLLSRFLYIATRGEITHRFIWFERRVAWNTFDLPKRIDPIA